MLRNERTGEYAEPLHLGWLRCHPGLKHRGLKPFRTKAAVLRNQPGGHWLDDVVEVLPSAFPVRPQAEVHLFRLAEFFERPSNSADEKGGLTGRNVVQICEAADVLAWRNDHGSKVQRTDAVVDDPSLGLVQQTARDPDAASRDIAAKASDFVHRVMFPR